MVHSESLKVLRTKSNIQLSRTYESKAFIPVSKLQYIYMNSRVKWASVLGIVHQKIQKSFEQTKEKTLKAGMIVYEVLIPLNGNVKGEEGIMEEILRRLGKYLGYI